MPPRQLGVVGARACKQASRPPPPLPSPKLLLAHIYTESGDRQAPLWAWDDYHTELLTLEPSLTKAVGVLPTIVEGHPARRPATAPPILWAPCGPREEEGRFGVGIG